MLATCSWPWSLPGHVVDISSVTPLKKTDFPSPGSYHLQSASWLGVDSVSTSPSRSWDLIWFEPVEALCVLLQSLGVHMSISPGVSGRCCSREPSATLRMDPRSLEGRGLVKTSRVGPSAPSTVPPCTLSSCGYLC